MMLDYFQVPVTVYRLEDLLAAVAKGINSTGEDRNEIAQAPDHYEIWQIGEVTEQGHIEIKREFITNCASLVRNGVWKRRLAGDPGTEGTTRPSPGAPGTPPR